MNFEKLFLDFLTSLGQVNFSTIVSFLLVSFVIFWIVVLGWVWTDSTERVASKSFRLLSVIIVAILLIPGLIIYLLIRPKATIEEIYWADLERRYLKFETAELGDCPSCGYQLQPGFVVCPQCGEKIKEKCEGCETYIDRAWRYCPVCGLERLSKKEAEIEQQAQEITTEVMQEAVESTREEIKEVVKSGRTRYAETSGIVNNYKKFRAGLKGLFASKKKESAEPTNEMVEGVPVPKKKNNNAPKVVDISRKAKKNKNKRKR